MARPRLIRASAINIAFADRRLHNKPAEYAKMFTSIYKTETYVPLRADRLLAIGSLGRVEKNGQLILRGVLYAVTSIDQMAWFNLTRRRPASEAERGRIRVPTDMAANYREYPYEFHCASHRLIFLSREGSLSISPLQVRSAFEKLCNSTSVRDTFGDVNVSIEQEPDSLSAILDAEDLRSLTILVRMPNAGFGGFDADIETKLGAVGASEAQAYFKAASDTRLIPDTDIRAAANVALSDGAVTAKIRIDGVIQEVSTEDSPVVETISYSPDRETRVAAFARAARILLRRIHRSE